MRIVKTLLDIDEVLIHKAQKILGVKTKKETVSYALEEIIRARKRGKLKEMIGQYHHGMNLKQLLALRTRL